MKIHILGAAGSRVTTLGRELARKLSIQYFDSDDYFWEQSNPPFTIRRDPLERNLSMETDSAKNDSWIIGGSMINWATKILEKSDLIVFLWTPPDVRMARLKEREFERYGKIIYTDPERIRLFEDFLTWAADYDLNTGISNRTKIAHEKWLAEREQIPILRIEGDVTVNGRISLILKKLSSDPSQSRKSGRLEL